MDGPTSPSNPLNGRRCPPTIRRLPRFCYVSNVPGCLDRAAAEQAPQAEYSHLSHDWQSSIGFQRQIGADMSVESDYVYTRGRDEKVLQDNANITFNPATGAPVSVLEPRDPRVLRSGASSVSRCSPAGRTTTGCSRYSPSASATGGRER